MSSDLQMQIEQAARGCVSGTLAEWPMLDAALMYRFRHDTPAAVLIQECRNRLGESVTHAEHFRLEDEMYGGIEVWWSTDDPRVEIESWLNAPVSELSMLSNVNDGGDNPEHEPYWRKLTPIDECYDRGLLRIRGIEYHCVRFENASPVGFIVQTAWLRDLPSPLGSVTTDPAGGAGAAGPPPGPGPGRGA